MTDVLLNDDKETINITKNPQAAGTKIERAKNCPRYKAGLPYIKK